MQIERSDKEIIIRVSAETDLTGLERILEFIRFREIASKSKASSKEVAKLAKESKESWWEKNKSKFLK
ncbi:hypothetical protein [Algoriphagus taiwanensis]|uniref:Uncharacterized protein n=1 Tax=Algoriphagus taiwanensis TaxID=1445656 RepID=A0ABQ6PYK6_9BACT|nr:hypothetical protein Ataiwa_01390 [Algoriphagus taiwanensis]